MGVSLEDLRAENAIPSYMAGASIVRQGTMFATRSRREERSCGVREHGSAPALGKGRSTEGLSHPGSSTAVAAAAAAGGAALRSRTTTAKDTVVEVAALELKLDQCELDQPHMITVAEGDTVRGVLAQYGITDKQLRTWNRKHFPVGERGRLLVGQPLIVRKL